MQHLLSRSSHFIGFCVVEWSEILHAFAQLLMTFWFLKDFNFHSRSFIWCHWHSCQIKRHKGSLLWEEDGWQHTCPHKHQTKSFSRRNRTQKSKAVAMHASQNTISLGFIKSIPNSTILSIQGVVYIWDWIEFLTTPQSFSVYNSERNACVFSTSGGNFTY